MDVTWYRDTWYRDIETSPHEERLDTSDKNCLILAQ
jgi:hypothetical protein